ncbi:MAG: exo-beta-N-acetylmuramidase NamZ domain-containing protein [Verrucomicrobiia bacterium]
MNGGRKHGVMAALHSRNGRFWKGLGTLTAAMLFAGATELALGAERLGSGVLNGIDVVASDDFVQFTGLRIGLITNHSGIDRERNPTIDLLNCAPGVDLRVLFSPEHGIRGALDEEFGDSVDQATGLPIYSLYGDRLAPTAEQLAGLDALVFDIQDIGCRFYTYISTLGHALKAAGSAQLRFFVLDRVNPINGVEIDGPVLTSEPSFTGFHAIPVRHGMTVGELARMFNTELEFNADLVVIPVRGWSRRCWFDEARLPWINPSPNMRSLVQASLYPGVGLLETANVSVGRGTGTPFEVVGAPYIDDLRFAAELNEQGIDGVRFVPIRFTPAASVFKNQECGGVSILLTDRQRCKVVDAGVVMAQVLHRLYPAQFGLEKFNRLLGHSATVEAIRNGETLARIRESWSADLDQFAKRRAQYLLY